MQRSTYTDIANGTFKFMVVSFSLSCDCYPAGTGQDAVRSNTGNNEANLWRWSHQR